MGVENSRFATADIPTLNQEQRDKVHAIAVCTLWGGPANSICGVDTKLVSFDVPAFD